MSNMNHFQVNPQVNRRKVHRFPSESTETSASNSKICMENQVNPNQVNPPILHAWSSEPGFTYAPSALFIIYMLHIICYTLYVVYDYILDIFAYICILRGVRKWVHMWIRRSRIFVHEKSSEPKNKWIHSKICTDFQVNPLNKWIQPIFSQSQKSFAQMSQFFRRASRAGVIGVSWQKPFQKSSNLHIFPYKWAIWTTFKWIHKWIGKKCTNFQVNPRKQVNPTRKFAWKIKWIQIKWIHRFCMHDQVNPDSLAHPLPPYILMSRRRCAG